MKGLENSLDLKLKDILPDIQYRILNNTTYFGIKTLKNPFDFWVYQEIIYELQPDIIIEIGNYNGGSTLALAHILDNINKGQVIGIDIIHSSVPEKVKNHPRISLVTGDACENFEKVKKLIKSNDNVLIIEDSAHSYKNTLNILNQYSSLIKKNSYFIVEDSICHHGLDVGPNPGPYEAIEEFIKINPNFIVDREKESFVITWNPKGFIKRIK